MTKLDLATDELADRFLIPSAQQQEPASSLRHSTALLLRRPTFTISAIVVLFWVAMAIGWRWLGVQPFAATGIPFQGPSAAHWFGTDNLGRDVFARVLAGAQSVMSVAPAATALAALVGTPIGLFAAWYRGIGDEVAMRICDVLTAFPGVISVILIVSAFGQSLPTVTLAIALFFAPLIARTVRAAALVERDKPYVDAARLQGMPTASILFREILPNVLPILVIESTLRLGYAIFVDAGLSFLGLGPEPPSPDWGLAVTQNRLYVQNAWWTVLFPALAIASLVVAVNLIADNLREVTGQ